MTFIQIDKIFLEINTLSQMISVPRISIEKIIDRGIENDSDLYMSSNTRDTINKMRFASYLVSLNISDEVSQNLLDAYCEDRLSSAIAQIDKDEHLENSVLNELEQWEIAK